MDKEPINHERLNITVKLTGHEYLAITAEEVFASPIAGEERLRWRELYECLQEKA